MPKAVVYNMAGEKVGEYELSESVFGIEPNTAVLHASVKNYLANQRQGTQSALTKGEVSYSTRKPWRQKGTGRARAGLRQSPVWRGGGIAFGPKPRDFSVKVNKKVVRLAFRRALSERIASGAVKLVEDLSMAAPNTEELRVALASLGAPSALIVLPAWDDNVLLSARNLPGVEVTTARNCSVYQVLRYPAVVMTRAAWEEIKVRFAGENTEETVA